MAMPSLMELLILMISLHSTMVIGQRILLSRRSYSKWIYKWEYKSNDDDKLALGSDVYNELLRNTEYYRLNGSDIGFRINDVEKATLCMGIFRAQN